MAAKQVIEFARNLSSKPGIIKEAKFQPAQPKKVTRARAAHKKPIRAVKELQIMSIFAPPSKGVLQYSAEEIRNAEEIRDDIIDIGGVDKFKTLGLKVIKGYYLRLEGPKATVPPLTKSKLANIVLQRLGMENWGSVFAADAPELSADEEKVALEIRKEIEDRAAKEGESGTAEELLESGVEKLDKQQLENYYHRLASITGEDESLPNLTKERLAALVLQRLAYPPKKKQGK